MRSEFKRFFKILPKKVVLHLYELFHSGSMARPLQEIFINNLKYYRKKNGYSQEVLSERLGKGTKYINKIESSISFPTVQVIEQMAALLGIKACLLFDEDGCPQNIVASDREQFIASVTDSLYQRLTADMRSVLEKLG